MSEINSISQNKVSFYAGGILQTKPTSNYSIAAVLSMIKSDKYKSICEKLRAATDKSIQSQIKKGFDYVTFSGEFETRHNDKLIQHSNCLCIDFDDLIEIDTARVSLQNDKYTFSLFSSPRNNGIKVLVIVDGNSHLASYLSLERYYLQQYGLVIDKACKDVARACFMSYDPNLFINENADVFNVYALPTLNLEVSEKPLAPVVEKEKTTTSVQAPAKFSEKEKNRIEYILKQIENNKIDITSIYDDWLKLAFAFSTLGEFGRDYFHRVSAFNAEYNILEVDKKFDQALKTRSTITTRNRFYTIAADYGLENKLPREVKENTSGKEMLPADASEEDFEHFGFFESRGMYWGMTDKGGKRPVSNFTMEILFHVKTGGEEAFRLIKIKNIHGYEAVINMNTDDFVSLTSFRKLIARRGNYLWKGREEDLTKLQDKLQREERPTELVDVLGYHPRGNFYAFANGLIDMDAIDIAPIFKPVDEYGIVAHKDKNYFIPAYSKMYADKDEQYYNYKKFVYKERELPLKDWYILFEEVYGDNGKIGFIFYVAALFSDIIYKLMGRRFPILCLYGLRGSGKGTFAESILCLFGEPQEQIMLGGNTTGVGFMRSFAQFRNAIVWLDEYKNSLLKKVIESIKNVYDRIGYKRGKKDHSFETDYVPVQSACILSGQEMPTIEPALFTRVIMLVFKDTMHSEGDRAKYLNLMNEQAKGLSHITIYLLRYGNFIELKFKETYEAEVKAIYKEINNNQVEDRLINNYACLSAICKLLLEKEKLGFAHHAFRNLLVKNLSMQHAVLQGSDDTTKFWQVVESLFNQGLIKEGQDFELADKKLFIRIQNICGLYEKEMRMRNDPNSLQKSTLENYLEIDKTKFVNRVRKQFSNGSYTWCMVFNYAELEINLIKRGDLTIEQLQYKYQDMGIKIDVNEKTLQQTGDAVETLPF